MADFIGVNFIAVQALEKRTRELKESQELLQSKIAEVEVLKAEIAEIKEILQVSAFAKKEQ
jgi:cell shape-determining protein MreC